MSVSHRLPLGGALLLAVCTFFLSACSSAEPPTAREHFEQLVGEWEGTHRLLDNPNEYPLVAYVVRRLVLRDVHPRALWPTRRQVLQP